jgi:hypothetical protein
MPTTLTPKDPEETIFYGTDFSPLVATSETISSASVSIRTISGTDDAPEAMLVDSPVIDGATVAHKITGGVAGCAYLLAFSVVTSRGQTFIESAPLKVIERN